MLPRFAAPWCLSIAFAVPALADCRYVPSGKVTLKVSSCRAIRGADEFGPKHPLAESIWRFPEKERKKLESSYDGLLLGGKFVSVKLDEVPPKGVAAPATGATFTAFAAGTQLTCATYQDQVVKSDLSSECCDGHAGVPCLLDTDLKLRNLSVAK